MNEFDQFLDQQLKLHNPDLREKAKSQILLYALERALAMLAEQGALSDAEKAILNEVFKAGSLEDDRLAVMFSSPERQQTFQAAFKEALDLAASTN
jgi:hypothetical protein